MKKLTLNKKTVADLDRTTLEDIKGGTAESQDCDVSMATDCNAPECKTILVCEMTEVSGCPRTD